MANPFPGMNPYLEDRALWNDVHHSVITYIRNALGYNENWQYRYSGGELLMMTASGEPSAYYPMDSNGLVISRLNPP